MRVECVFSTALQMDKFKLKWSANIFWINGSLNRNDDRERGKKPSKKNNVKHNMTNSFNEAAAIPGCNVNAV